MSIEHLVIKSPTQQPCDTLSVAPESCLGWSCNSLSPRTIPSPAWEDDWGWWWLSWQDHHYHHHMGWSCNSLSPLFPLNHPENTTNHLCHHQTNFPTFSLTYQVEDPLPSLTTYLSWLGFDPVPISQSKSTRSIFKQPKRMNMGIGDHDDEGDLQYRQGEQNHHNAPTHQLAWGSPPNKLW